MNEFIVLYADKDDKYCFSKEFTLDELVQQLHLDEISDTPGLKDCKVDCILPSVGKTDINNKKIYADYSIVEFEYKPIGETEYKKDSGFIFWCKEDFMYKINILTRADRFGENYIFNFGDSLNRMHMKSLKIIDTIQQNKLGLTK